MTKIKLRNEINKFYRTINPEYGNCHIAVEDLKDENCMSQILYDLKENFKYELYYEVKKYIKKFKSAQTIGVILMGLGIVFVIGTVGSMDLNTISSNQSIMQLIIGLAVTTTGFISYRIGGGE